MRGDGPAPAPASRGPAPAAAAAPPARLGSLARSLLYAAPFAGAREPAPLPAGAEVWVSGDDSTLARAVLRALERRGLAARLVALALPSTASQPAALVLLAPDRRLGEDGLWSEESEGWLKQAFQLAKAAGPGLRAARGALLTVSRLGGAFGVERLPEGVDPLFGGLAGLAKTAGREWPEVRCRALDLGLSDEPALAEAIAAELELAGPAELGVSSAGAIVPELRPAPIERSQAPLGPGDAILVTGGARGVTAEAAVALAQACRGPIVLLGRTPLPGPEPEWLASLSTEAELKKALAARETQPSPKRIEAAFRACMAGREIRATLRRIEAAGSRAVYVAADVRDAAAVRAALEGATREAGPIRALVHGAGVLADRFIQDKTAEQFDAVFDTKVAGLRHLLACVGLESLKVLALFSSVSGRRGRAGQADYAMANEALNKVAQSLAARRPACRVVSVNWGPWEGGMVTPSLRTIFEQEGVGLLDLTEGGRHLVAELGARGVEPLVAQEEQKPSILAPVFERVLAPRSHAFLASHAINGQPVLPVAMMIEWLAHGALHGNPGLSFCGLEDLRVFRGVIVKDGPKLLRVAASKAEREGDAWAVTVELQGESGPHARCRVLLSQRPPAPDSPARAVPALEAYPRSVADAYRDLLFHGELLRGIEAVEGCSGDGIAVRLAAAPAPAAWMEQPVRGAWLSQPLAVDSAFQAMILWSFERHGSGCLPNAVRRYRQYRPFPKQGLRAWVAVTRHNEQAASADVDFLDSRGELVARIEGSEHTIDPSLKAAFRKGIPA
ncbi:MAG: SDR family NAD(P)-dependent oxidoreductase [Elusimicrobia bacterium]|nr:SDR family NAD(P)-dependent oxidoreductase [Elusimicrobiota bacterium]